VKRALLAVLVVAAMAGCSARGAPDYFAYTKKPIYVGSFDLAHGADRQNFYVEDGSIGQLRAQVWINATAGGARVDVVGSSGATVWSTSASGSQALRVDLGQWTVTVTPTDGAAGEVEIVVVRA